MGAASATAAAAARETTFADASFAEHEMGATDACVSIAFGIETTGTTGKTRFRQHERARTSDGPVAFVVRAPRTTRRR